MTLKVRALAAALFIMAVTAPFVTYAQETDNRPIKYVRGRIYGINWAGSKITIQWFYSTDELANDKITFATPDSVQVFTDRDKIFKDVRPVGISALMIDDHVIVGYRDGKGDKDPEAVTIRVMEHDKPLPP